MLRASRLRDYGVRVSMHAEEPELIGRFTAIAKDALSAGKVKPLEAYHIARSPESEVIAIASTMYISRFTNCPVNILHISSFLAFNEPLGSGNS